MTKLLNERASFTWQELVTLAELGDWRLEGSGSWVKFDNGDPQALISLHRPHSGNELKTYVRRQIVPAED